MRPFRFLLLILAFVASPGILAAAESIRTDTLVIETEAGGRYRFKVEIAETPAQMAQGLMYRKSMPLDAGMLFVHPQERVATMWMKNTFIPLDMIFIDAAGRITNIHEQAVPHSLATIASSEPVLGVLEVNGGIARRLGIRPGDRVVHSAFGQ